MFKRYEEMHISKKRDLWLGIAVVGMVNVMAYLLELGLLGGTAWGGVIRNGHYFVVEKARLTEVAPFLYYFNYLHTILLFITCPIAAFAASQYKAVKDAAEDYNPITRGHITGLST